MKTKNSPISRVLSVILTAVMVFTMISVGIIIPDFAPVPAVKAAAIECNSVATINSAIATANSAGSGTVTTIKLTGDINGGETNAMTAITGNVLFDFNGHTMKFEYNNEGLDNDDNSNWEQQLPAELQSTYNNTNVQEVVNKGMLNVASGGRLQIINSSSGNGGLTVKTYVYGDDSDGRHFWGSRKNTTWKAAASGVYSEGTLILGDYADTSKNNFTIRTQARAGTDSDGYDKRNMTANSYAVTVDNSAAKFYMYGGTLESLATTRTNYNGNSNSRCFTLNINSCYCAEIYGGSLNIPGDDECGVRNSDGNKSDDGTCYFAALRVNTANVYVFNATCSVGIYVGDDTDKVNTSTADIYVPNASALPCIYGGKFINTSAGVDESSAGWDHNYCILGQFSYADGSVKPGTDKSETVNGTKGWRYVYRAAITTQYFITLFHFADGATENGLYPWNYDTFRDYVAAVGSSSDVYKSSGAHTYINDSSAHATDTNRSYLRNGWHYDYWMGSKMPGNDGDTRYDNLGEAGLNAASGGSLFMYPAWLQTNYTITYDLNDTEGNNRASNASGAPTTYTIRSTSTLPTPTRDGYNFGGWIVDSKSVPSTDTVTTAWLQGSTYPAGTSLTGKNGNVAFKALWTPISYTATFNHDNIPAGVTGTATTTTADYNVNTQFTFPSAPAKDHYTATGSWKVTTAAGSWSAGSSYEAGTQSPAGAYGNPTFTAQYTPINYTITFNANSGVDVTAITYNYESTGSLPATTRLGYTFCGWEVETGANGAWAQNTGYPSGTSLNHKFGNVTLKAKWESTTSTVSLYIPDGVTPPSATEYTYSFSSTLEIGTASRPGYTFAGWKVKSETHNSGDLAENLWGIGDQYLLLDGDTTVTLPAGKLGNVTLEPIWTLNSYTLTYNTNGGSLPSGTATEKSFNIEDTFNLAAVTKAGYTFTGWSVITSSGNWTETSLSAGAAISGKYGDVTIKANWEETEYTVTLNAGGGTAGVSSLIYKIGSQLSLAGINPVRTGYTFTGWKLTEKAASSSWTVGTEYTDAVPAGYYGDMTLTAQWTHTDYTITFTGGAAPQQKTYHIDDSAFTLSPSTDAGCTFDYWVVTTITPAGNTTWTQNEHITTGTPISGRYGNVTLTAHFTANNYTITYYGLGDVQYGSADTYTIADPITLRGDYSADGYIFNGWRVGEVADGAVWTVDSVIPATALTLDANLYYGNVSLYADLTPETYTATFDSDGGSYCQNVSYTIESEDTLPTPTKTGYTFTGWKVVTAAGNWTAGSVLAADAAYTGKFGNVALKATWSANPYNITFVVGRAGDATEDIVIPSPYDSIPNEPASAVKAKPADAQYTYTFDHWEPALTAVKGEKTYTAVYSKTINSYTVTWKYTADESGVYTTSADTLAYGSTPVFNGGTMPSKASSDTDDHTWRFAGWSATENGTVLDSIPAVTGNATYYAVFTFVDAPCDVTWIVDGVSNTVSWGVGELPVYPGGSPSKADSDGLEYTFDSWEPEVVTVERGRSYTYTAKFTSSEKTFTLSFNANGGTASFDTLTYVKSDGITFPTAARDGYTFLGWQLDTYADGAASWLEQSADINADGLYIGGEWAYRYWGDVSFTAVWSPINYTVRFNVTSDVTGAQDKIYNIESTDTLPVLTRDGYDLVAWIVAVAGGNWQQGQTLDDETVLTGYWGNVTLQPVWNAKYYTIKWVSGDEIQTDSVQFGNAIIEYSPMMKQGYNAVWDSEVPATMPAENLTFTAVYTPIEYTVRVNGNGGSVNEDFTYTIESAGSMPVPTRDGATFNGWLVTNAQGNWTKNSVVAGGTAFAGRYGNISVTAQWTLRTCAVYWDLGDRIVESRWYYGALPYFDGTPSRAPDAENSYVFTGWDREIVPVTEDEVTYVAQYDLTERKYSVIWNIDGAELRQEYSYGDTPVYSGSTPERLSNELYDYSFKGWASAPGGTVVDAIPAVTADITYYAQFDYFTKLLGLSINKSAMFFDNIDENSSQALEAQIYPANASVKDVRWTSLNPEVATVDEYGLVTALKAGLAVVKVSSVDGRFNAFCVVSVSGRHTRYLEISAGGLSTTNLTGAMIQLTATLQPDNATNTGYSWSSSDTTVASVDANGLVTYINPGTAVITCSADDGYALGSIEVKTTRDASEVVDHVRDDTVYQIIFVGGTSPYYLGKNGTANTRVLAGNFRVTRDPVTNEFPEITIRVGNPKLIVVFNGVQQPVSEDGVYTITDIHENISVATIASPITIETEEVDDGQPKLSFFDRLGAFFRKIVEFFRSLFGR